MRTHMKCTQMHPHVYKTVCLRASMRAYMRAHMCPCMSACASARVHARTRVRMHACVHAYLHAARPYLHACTRTHASTHARTHAHMHHSCLCAHARTRTIIRCGAVASLRREARHRLSAGILLTSSDLRPRYGKYGLHIIVQM